MRPGAVIDPGHLRMRLNLEEPAVDDDGQGGSSGEWRHVAGLWAKLEPVGASHLEQASQIQQAARYRVTLRHRSDVVIGMRFTRFERVFHIQTVTDPDETERYLVCACEERS
jgi:SPP1 family predicted phage head-tail adaptor